MANNTTTSGITKIERDGVFTYYFPIARIVANNTAGTVALSVFYGTVPSQEILVFADITDKLGANTPEGYVDALAANKAFFLPEDQGDIKANQLSLLNQNALIDSSLTQIADLLKNILYAVNSLK